MSDEQQSNTLKYAAIGTGVAALALVGLGIGMRYNAESKLRDVAAEASIASVAVVRPTLPDSEKDASGGLVLPGNVQAYNSAPIYARTNGYVRRWLVDIGDAVARGQTLAVLDAPEIDQQLAQARADYQTALAEQKLARVTADRWAVMRAKDAVSQQEADEKAGDLSAKTAVANARLANVKRLGAMQGFTRLTAPFPGIITSRSAQVGALVTSGNANAQPLFTVADIHRMRVYVRVPQSASSLIHKGMHGTMTLPEYPGRSFDAVLTRSADAVDAKSGTVLVEMQADNADHMLKPGSFAQVALPIDSSASGKSMRIPVSALIFDKKGASVGVVKLVSRNEGKVTVKPVMIGRDHGQEVEITSGLTSRDYVIATPPDALATGDIVRVEGASATAD